MDHTHDEPRKFRYKTKRKDKNKEPVLRNDKLKKAFKRKKAQQRIDELSDYPLL